MTGNDSGMAAYVRLLRFEMLSLGFKIGVSRKHQFDTSL